MRGEILSLKNVEAASHYSLWCTCHSTGKIKKIPGLEGWDCILGPSFEIGLLSDVKDPVLCLISSLMEEIGFLRHYSLVPERFSHIKYALIAKNESRASRLTFFGRFLGFLNFISNKIAIFISHECGFAHNHGFNSEGREQIFTQKPYFFRTLYPPFFNNS